MNDVTRTISPEWYNENALRAYPIRDDCPAADRLPSWFVADLRVSADSAYDTVFVSSAYLSETLVSIAVSGVSGTNPPVGLLARTVTRDELEPWRSYAFDSLDGLASGTVVFGEIPSGAAPFKFAFTKDEAPLAANAVVSVRTPGVTRLVDRAHGTFASGIIDLSGNSEFRTSLGADGAIVVELTDLYRDLTTSVCSASPSFDHCGEIPITSVNGVTPDDSGVLRLRFR